MKEYTAKLIQGKCNQTFLRDINCNEASNQWLSRVPFTSFNCTQATMKKIERNAEETCNQIVSCIVMVNEFLKKTNEYLLNFCFMGNKRIKKPCNN